MATGGSEYASDDDGTATDGDLMDDVAASYRNDDDYDVTSHWYGSYYYPPGLAVPASPTVTPFTALDFMGLVLQLVHRALCLAHLRLQWR